MLTVGCFVPWCWFPVGDRAVSGAMRVCEHAAAPQAQGCEELSLTSQLFLPQPFFCLHSPVSLYSLPWQEEVSQCAQGLKIVSKIGKVSAFLYVFPFFLAVYSARRTGSYYIKMLFLVINPRHGGCSWHFPSNLLFSLVNSYLIAHTD